MKKWKMSSRCLTYKTFLVIIKYYSCRRDQRRTHPTHIYHKVRLNFSSKFSRVDVMQIPATKFIFLVLYFNFSGVILHFWQVWNVIYEHWININYFIYFFIFIKKNVINIYIEMTITGDIILLSLI